MKLLLIFSFCLFPYLGGTEEIRVIKDFELSTFDGSKKLKLSELVKRKKVFLNFWASWCTACKKEIEELEALKKKYPEVIFIGINAGEKIKKVKKFLKKTGFSFEILEDKKKKYSKSIGVLSLPQSFVVDKDMKVIYHNEKPPKSL